MDPTNMAALIANLPRAEGPVRRPQICDRCGGDAGGPQAFCSACLELVREEVRSRRMREARERIPVTFRDLDIPLTDRRHLAARSVLAALRAGRGALLHGPAGSGKTTTAMLVLLAVLDSFEYEIASGVQVVSAYDLAKAPLEHRLGSGDAPLVRTSKRASVLLLDELGSEQVPQTRSTSVSEVIFERYNAQRPTIATTWLAPTPAGEGVETIAKKYGDGIARRLLEQNISIDFGGAR